METVASVAQDIGDFMKFTWDEIDRIIDDIGSKAPIQGARIYGVPRGGAIVAGLLRTKFPSFKYGMQGVQVVTSPEAADVIVDDIIDSGRTQSAFAKYTDKPFIALVTKNGSEWVEFPWERPGNGDGEETVLRLLQFLGLDATTPGLRDTPARVIRMYQELLTQLPVTFTTFPSDGYDEMIVESNIEFFSLCEHHMVPFFGTADVGYIPDQKIVGLSKLARVVEYYARGLQVQERLTQQIADRLEKELQPKGVGVVIRARHLCQEMRGIKKRDIMTTTSSLKGLMFNDHKARQEFLSLAHR